MEETWKGRGNWKRRGRDVEGTWHGKDVEGTWKGRGRDAKGTGEALRKWNPNKERQVLSSTVGNLLRGASLLQSVSQYTCSARQEKRRTRNAFIMSDERSQLLKY